MGKRHSPAIVAIGGGHGLSAVLRGLKRAIRACPHIARGEKLRAMLFCQNPELVYRAAKAWGDFTERRKGARHA